MLDKEHPFPVTEVGLGQVGILRLDSHPYDHRGQFLQKAARMLRSRLDPSAPLPPARKRRRKSNGPLPPSPSEC